MIIYLGAISPKGRYNRIYLAYRKAGIELSVLVSYFYFKKENIEEFYNKNGPLNIFADSGAFSAHSQLQEISVEEYSDWLHKWKPYFTAYANLDVKGDLDKSIKNQRYLEQQGHKPLPVFHAGEPWDFYADLLKEYKYVALGGVAGEDTSKASLKKWLIKCWRMAEENGCKLHGFGITTLDFLKSINFHTVDSTTWLDGPKYGHVHLFSPYRQRFISIQLWNDQSVYKSVEVLKLYGLHPRELLLQSSYDYAKIASLVILSWIELQDWLTNY